MAKKFTAADIAAMLGADNKGLLANVDPHAVHQAADEIGTVVNSHLADLGKPQTRGRG